VRQFWIVSTEGFISNGAGGVKCFVHLYFSYWAFVFLLGPHPCVCADALSYWTDDCRPSSVFDPCPPCFAQPVVTSSSRCCPPIISSVTVDHDVSMRTPSSSGRRGSLITPAVTILLDYEPPLAFPHGHHRFSAASGRGDRTLDNRFDRAA
jgi:hypothetical protein